MFKKWIEDIRIKTKNMDRAQKKEYIMAYYWYHMVIAVILVILTAVVIYHFTLGNNNILFSLAIINQENSYERDEKIQEDFSRAYGISSKDIMVDSDYLLSYGNIHPVNANESMFEKFFLGWNAGAIDAAVIPESFLKYCTGKDGEFMDITDIWDNASPEEAREYFYKHNNVNTGIYIDKTTLAGDFASDSKDPLLLVFMKNSSHIKECRDFVKFII